MESNSFERLFGSLGELEQTIAMASELAHATNSASDATLFRLTAYFGILKKQRALAMLACDHVRAGNWEDVRRLIELIRALASMMREDAENIAVSDGHVTGALC